MDGEAYIASEHSPGTAQRCAAAEVDRGAGHGLVAELGTRTPSNKSHRRGSSLPTREAGNKQGTLYYLPADSLLYNEWKRFVITAIKRNEQQFIISQQIEFMTTRRAYARRKQTKLYFADIYQSSTWLREDLRYLFLFILLLHQLRK